jgi:uncharacterized membrane protein (UPF0136 family)
MGTQNIDSVRTAIGAGSLGFGVLATLSPKVLRRAYGDSTSSGGALDYFGRTWGTRTAVLGALTLMASSDAERTRIAGLAAAMNAADSLAAFSARDMPGRTRVMAGLTSAGFAAAAGYVALNG